MRKVLLSATGAGVLLAALLQARGVSALVAAELVPPASVLAASHDATPARDESRARARSAEAVLARNPFDHTTGSLVATDRTPAEEGESPPAPCPSVRSLFTVRGEDDDGSLAALAVDGKKVLRARGGDAGERRVVRVGFDRVWLARGDDDVCIAHVFGRREEPAPKPAEPRVVPAGLDPRIQRGVVRASATETHVDRAALEALEEALSSGKLRAVPEREGGRLVGLRLGRVDPTSVPALLGFESSDRLDAIGGIELNDTSALLEGWARLRAGAQSRVPVRVLRGGKTMQLDFVVK